jgi:hypothetical protein
MKYYSLYFAQSYNEGAYGEGSYACTEVQIANDTCDIASAGTGGAGGSGANGSGGLVDTGLSLLVLATLACFVVFVALLVRIWRRQRPALQEAGENQSRGLSPELSGSDHRRSID